MVGPFDFDFNRKRVGGYLRSGLPALERKCLLRFLRAIQNDGVSNECRIVDKPIEGGGSKTICLVLACDDVVEIWPEADEENGEKRKAFVESITKGRYWRMDSEL